MTALVIALVVSLLLNAVQIGASAWAYFWVRRSRGKVWRIDRSGRLHEQADGPEPPPLDPDVAALLCVLVEVEVYLGMVLDDLKVSRGIRELWAKVEARYAPTVPNVPDCGAPWEALCVFQPVPCKRHGGPVLVLTPDARAKVFGERFGGPADSGVRPTVQAGQVGATE
jgi:hypothetical protein